MLSKEQIKKINVYKYWINIEQTLKSEKVIYNVCLDIEKTRKNLLKAIS